VPDLLRPGRLAALVVVVALVAGAVVNRTTLGAQARAAVVLAAVADTPVVTDVAELVTGEPRADEAVVAGVPTTLFRPAGDGPWPAVVFVNGVTRRGRFHPTVRRLAEAFAGWGYLMLVPDPPGLASGELTPATAAATARVAELASRMPDAEGGRVGFVGVSAGGSLALLAAARPALCERVTVVSAVAPFTDLADVVRLATTGYHAERGRLVPYAVDPFVALVVARSLTAALPPGRDRRVLLRRLRVLDDDAPAPLAAVAGARSHAGRSLIALLRNRDPVRFDMLFARLPARVRAAARRLSPIYVAPRVCARVELVSAREDKYFPPAESRAFARAARDARVTISSTLQHADLELSLGQIADLARLDAFIVRSLRAARG
jgi:pimeloyl-ACP methyl ester carboxylesterase